MSEPHAVALVIEDEPNLRRFVRMSLETEDCAVYEADSIKRGLIEAAARRPDIVLLDLGLPDGNGIDFIREVRTWSDVPIIVLSARTAEPEKVLALDVGADDYLTKPFGPAELLARVRAHLRRRSRSEGSTSSVHAFGDIQVDLARRTVERNGSPIHLTPIEYRLLSSLLASPGSVLTHRHLLNAVWGPSHLEDNHYVRVHMASLRKKIERDPAQPRHLVTEAGIGYRFVT